MPRYKLTLEYDGTDYVGFQRQDSGPSIQAALEMAAERLCQQTVIVFAAGRTDAGVHATGQVVHFDLPKAYPPDTVRDALNAHLRPQPIAILHAEAVSETFHARFAATRRTYRYIIVNRTAPLALAVLRAWHVRHPLNIAAMNAAAAHVLGHHDFSSFRATQCQAKSPHKTLDHLALHRDGERVVLAAHARSFLHHQVRNLTGTLVQVGLGRLDADALPAILAARDRAAAGPTAPACGLYLTGVAYDRHVGGEQLQAPFADQQADEEIGDDEGEGDSA